MTNFIDTHVHFWDVSNRINNWLVTVPELNKNYLIEDYLSNISNLFDTDKIVIIEAANSKDAMKELEWLEFITRNSNLLQFRYIPHIDMLADSDIFISQLDRYAKYEEIVGFRHILSYRKNQQYSPCDYDFTLNQDLIKKFVNNIAILTKNHMVCELQMYSEQLLRVYPFIEKHSNAKLVIEHCGLPTISNDKLSNEWFEMLDIYQHIAYFKISGFELTEVEFYAPQIINELLIRGTKLLFGSNLPISSGENIKLILKQIDLISNIVNQNAERIYG